MHYSDNELMQRLIDLDDMSAFDTLVLRHRKSAVAFAQRYTNDYHFAEDLAQEAFARIYLKRQQYKNTQGEFRTYLFHILRNICIDHYRKNARSREEKLYEDLPDDVEASPEETSIRHETYGFLRRLFHTLDEQYRTVLYLQEFEGLSYQKIAEAMGLSEGQVRMLLYRGRKKFKKLAQEELKGT